MHAFDDLTKALDAISRHTLGVVEAVVAWRKELAADSGKLSAYTWPLDEGREDSDEEMGT